MFAHTRSAVATACLMACISLGAGGVAACGSSKPKRRQNEAFSRTDARVFDDAIDFIEDPSALDATWRQEWTRNLEQRVDSADFIGRVTIRTVRTDIDLDRRGTYRLVADVEDRLFGRKPRGELLLLVREGSSGYTSVHRNEHRVLNGNFLAYIKRYQDESGQTRTHWHLSPPTDPILRRTVYLIERRRERTGDSHRRVIRRTN